MNDIAVLPPKLTMEYFDVGMLSVGSEMVEGEGISAFHHNPI